jgi:thiamine-phosphate pyrophosphorylase
VGGQLSNSNVHPRLYLVTGEDASNGRSTIEISQAAIDGGVDILQMREKGMSYGERSVLGKELSRRCHEHEVLFIVNDDPLLAKEVDADGVHIGQEDLECWPLEKIRAILGKGKFIGLSTHSIEQVERSSSYDVDYISYGPVFPTQTKDYFIGAQGVSTVLAMMPRPVVFIGGINLDNVDVLLKKGVKNIAVIRAITQAEDITARVIELKNRLSRGDAAMKIKINGKDETVPSGSTIHDLVAIKGLVAEGLVVEHNSDLIPPERWASVHVKEDDLIELISFVGGG